MIARAQGAGIDAQHLLADAWFGTKPMIAMADDALLTSVVRMKKNTMKHRHTLHLPDKVVCQIWICAPCTSLLCVGNGKIYRASPTNQKPWGLVSI